MPLKVEKRDGRTEEFDRIKIVNGIVKSGATPEQAEVITTEIEKWAQGVAVDGVVKTSYIRAKVLEHLRTASPEAANNFAAYKKPT